jgi:hypothetical protein
MRRIFESSVALAAAFLLFPAGAQGQTVTDGAYNITHTTGTYTSIVGAPGVNVVFGNNSGSNFDDSQSSPIPMGFTFNFYGTPYTTASVCTNGFITMPSSTATNFTNSAFDANFAGNAGAALASVGIIAPFWDDLFFTAGQPGALLTLTRTVAGHQEFVVEYDRVAFFGDTLSTVSFQAVLRDNGTMALYYPNTGTSVGHAGGASATIGIRPANGTPTLGAQWSFNTVSVANGDLLNITPVPEPTSLALAGLGFGGLMLRYRRKKPN